MNNLISWVKRTICCSLSGRESSQKAWEETWGMSEPNLPGGVRRSSDASDQHWDSLERHSPNPCQGRTGAGSTGTTGSFSVAEGGQRRKGKLRKAQAEHPPTLSRARAQPAPVACAGSSPARPSCAAWGSAGKCLPLSLIYFAHCSASSLLSRAWRGWVLCSWSTAARLWAEERTRCGHGAHPERLRTPFPLLSNLLMIKVSMVYNYQFDKFMSCLLIIIISSG